MSLLFYVCILLVVHCSLVEMTSTQSNNQMLRTDITANGLRSTVVPHTCTRYFRTPLVFSNEKDVIKHVIKEIRYKRPFALCTRAIFFFPNKDHTDDNLFLLMAQNCHRTLGNISLFGKTRKKQRAIVGGADVGSVYRRVRLLSSVKIRSSPFRLFIRVYNENDKLSRLNNFSVHERDREAIFNNMLSTPLGRSIVVPRVQFHAVMCSSPIHYVVHVQSVYTPLGKTLTLISPSFPDISTHRAPSPIQTLKTLLNKTEE